MSKKLIGLILITAFLLLPVQALAAEWFVRPAGQQYGTGNGTSYANAWSGLGSVPLGPGGMMPGDTLWICGLHVHDVDQLKRLSGYYRELKVLSGLSEAERTVIRGDYKDDPGVIWGAGRLVNQQWTNEGGGVYSVPLYAAVYGKDWIFQDIGASGPESHVVLDPAKSLDECRNTPGSHYSPDYATGSKLYIHATDNAVPGDRIAVNWWGYQITIPSNSQFITLKGLTYYNPYRFKVTGLNAVTWEGCKLIYGWHSLITPIDANQNLQVLNCEFGWAGNGIYNVSQTAENGWNDTVRNFTYSGNYFHDIGVRENSWNRDAHAIGIQGGDNGVIENNVAVNCGNAIMLYAYTPQDLKNVTVRNNLVKDTHRYGDNSGYGIGTMCNNDSLSEKSGNVFYHNVVVNASVGYRFQFEWEQVFVNNVAVNCEIGMQANRGYYAPDGAVYGSKITARNNIFLNSSKYHIEFNTPIAIAGAHTFLDMDNDTYYPANGEMFKIASNKYTFESWQGTKRDVNGTIVAPRFLNRSGNYEKLEDFDLPADSELRDKGVEIAGVTTDAFGKTIVDKPEPGIYELPPVVDEKAADTTPTTEASAPETTTPTTPPSTPETSTDTSPTTEPTTTASTEPVIPYWQTILKESYEPTTREERKVIVSKMYDFWGITVQDWKKLTSEEQTALREKWNNHVEEGRLAYFKMTYDEYRVLPFQTRLNIVLHYEQEVLAVP